MVMFPHDSGMKMIGREKEIRILEEALESEESQFVAVYGFIYRFILYILDFSLDYCSDVEPEGRSK